MSVRAAPDETQRTSHAAADQRGLQIEPSSLFAAQRRIVLAVSGFVMLSFVVLHMAGNLWRLRQRSIQRLRALSREIGTPVVGEGTLLGLARVVLAGALALHLVAHLYIMREPTNPPWEVPGDAHRPSPASASYAPAPPWYATLPVAWLQATGGLIALFVAFHVAQLTVGATHPAFIPDDPYHNLVAAPGLWPVSIAYITAAAAVGAHLLPGIWTDMQSLGLIRPGTEALAGTLSAVVPPVLTIGMAAVPLAVLIGVLR